MANNTRQPPESGSGSITFKGAAVWFVISLVFSVGLVMAFVPTTNEDQIGGVGVLTTLVIWIGGMVLYARGDAKQKADKEKGRSN